MLWRVWRAVRSFSAEIEQVVQLPLASPSSFLKEQELIQIFVPP
jgi:hypothetical protein